MEGEGEREGEGCGGEAENKNDTVRRCHMESSAFNSTETGPVR